MITIEENDANSGISTDKNIYLPILTIDWYRDRSINTFQTINIVFHHFDGSTHYSLMNYSQYSSLSTLRISFFTKLIQNDVF